MFTPKDGFGLLLSESQRSKLFSRLIERMERYVREVGTYPVPASGSAKGMEDLLREFDFNKPRDPSELLDWVADQLSEYQLHTAHPAYYGVFNPNPATMGIAGEALSAAFNPQLASSRSALFCISVEDHLLAFFARQFGYDASAQGNFTSGGTEANHTALLCALSQKLPQFANRGLAGLSQWPKIYTTKDTHHSILRAARLCGLGTDAVVELAVDKDLKFDCGALSARIEADKTKGDFPLMVVGTLGTTSAGVVDPLAELSRISKQHDIWFHVDAAWGGAACLLDEFKDLCQGVELSDSIAFDPHKWLSLPMGIGLFLTPHTGILRKTFGVEQSFYMPEKTFESEQTEPYRQSMQWSRRFIGLKLFMTLAAHGLPGYQNVLRHQVEMGNYLREQLKSQGWEIVNQTPLPVVCFRDKQDLDLEKLSETVAATKKTWITTTKINYDGKKVLRAGISNFATQKEHVDLLVNILGQARLS